MKLFDVTNTTLENLQVAKHKSVSFTRRIELSAAADGLADDSGELRSSRH